MADCGAGVGVKFMDIFYKNLEDKAPSQTGPGQISSGGLWPEIERQAAQDPKAQALLELKNFIKDELILLKREGGKLGSQLEDYQKSLRRTDNLLIGIVVVVSAAFITTISLVFFDLIKEKDIYLQNNNLYQNYSERNVELSDTINDQKNEILILKNEIQRIYDKNNYLK